MEMHRLKKIIFLRTCKMVVINAQKYKNARVLIITVGNRELFWVNMNDVQEGLGVKNISDFKSMVFLRLQILQKSKLENTKELRRN